jgi:protein-S-isoprenylcysteine O-methyltransferase Ste14
MKPLFVISFLVCLVCFILRTIFNLLRYTKIEFAAKKNNVRGVMGIMFLLWASWFQILFNDPLKVNLPGMVKYGGLIIFLIGFTLFVLSHVQLKGFEDKGKLVRNGIYRKIRNPMYLGFILWIIGLPLLFEAMATLISGLVWIPFFIYWKILEEKELDEKYEDYKEYKKNTWF